MSDDIWICLNMPEYAWVCLNLSEWLLFYISPFHDLFNNPFSIWTRGYLFECIQEARGYSLEKHEAVCLKTQNLIFSIAAGSISFVFCFRINILTSKIQICCYLSGPRGRGVGDCESWCTLLVLCFFLVKTFKEIT